MIKRINRTSIILLVIGCNLVPGLAISQEDTHSNLSDTEYSRVVIPTRNHIYSDISNNVVINSNEELNYYIKLAEAKISEWSDDSNFISVLKSEDFDFESMNLIIFFHSETSGSTEVSLAEPIWQNNNALFRITRTSPDIGTADMAYYAYAFMVTKKIQSVIFELSNRRVVIENNDLTTADIWGPTSHYRECTYEFAIKGETHPVCYDFIDHESRGPTMLAIQSETGTENLFAIGVYEVSTSQYSRYCKFSGKCDFQSPYQTSQLPVSGISIRDVQEYSEWLSNRTGKKYRLPTMKEWIYAVEQAGNHLKSESNCDSSGPWNVNSGPSGRGWGLINYIGNIQEWVIDDNYRLLAVGGSFGNSLEECDISIVKEHNGEGDEYTGFRILVEVE